MRWFMEEYFKSHSIEYKKPLEISHWGALQSPKSLFKWPMAAILSLELDKEVTVGKTLKHLTKLLDRLQSIGHGYDVGMKSTSVMAPTNGMVHKLKEELHNNGALLFTLICLAYLDVGGEHLFSFVVYMFLLCLL